MKMNKFHTRYFHLKYLEDAIKGKGLGVLDVGCGIGFYTRQLAEKMPNVRFSVCDIDGKSIAEFKKNISKNKKQFVFKVCDAQNLPFKSKSFDAVIITDVLEHLKKPEAAIKEAARVIKKNGIFHLAVPLEGELTTYDGWIRLIFNKNFKEKPIGHIQQFKKIDIVKLLKQNGFEIKKTRYTYFWFYQTLSVLYFLFVGAVNKGKYIKVHGHDSAKMRIKLLESLIALIGWITTIESYLFSRAKGQTLHITSKKI